MIPDAPAARSSPLKTWGIRLAKAAITFLALYLTWKLLAGIRWSDLGGRVSSAAPAPLAMGIAVLTLRYLLWDFRFRLACVHAAERSSSVTFGFFVLMASAALNLITPSARLIGGLVRARYFARDLDRPFGFLYGVVLYDQVAHQAMMTACTWITIIVASFALDRQGLGWAALIALLAILAGLFWWSRRQGSGPNPLIRLLARRAEKAEGRMQAFYSHGHEAVEVFVRLLALPRLRSQAAILGIGFFLANAVAQWLIFMALRQPVNPFVVIAGVALGQSAGTLSGTPGGLGTTEAAMVASFEAMGVDPIEAAAGTLLFRGLHYAIVLALGLPALAAFEMRGGGSPRALPLNEGTDQAPHHG